MSGLRTNQWLVVLLAVAMLTDAAGEYRVALLVGEPATTRLAAAQLEPLGFRCDHSPELSDQELRRLIEGWSGSTPTNSTALIYFEGEVRSERIDGKPAACLLGSNQRPLAISQVFTTLGTRGGSRRNLVIAPGTPPGAPPVEPPAGCEFYALDVAASMSAAHLGGRGSSAIAPPQQFVLGRNAGDEWVNPRGMIFCWCPPGRYLAGSPAGTAGRPADEAPREVVIHDGFWIGKYEHTAGQRLRNLNSKMVGSHKNEPVNLLHWDDGSRMLTNTLTSAEHEAGHLPPDWQYTLPTEDQWEYAARAGTTTGCYFGDDLALLPQHANFADRSAYDRGDIYSNYAHRTLDDGFAMLAPVGSFKPNPWGLHDVYGNVAEWCIDLAARGGSWVSVAENCRSAYRDRYSARDEQIYLGYRIIIQKTPPPPDKPAAKQP